ncbi:MAG: methyltransferase domain-containing protein [Actinobacteria bacterium]|nr:methyltransferase domain-containing protein [Actinomycetota bacterium]
MAWYFAVVERFHEIQNPTSVEKIRLLGERLGLGPGSHVLDVGSGRGGPALVLAGEFGCRITSVERAEEFHSVARERVREAGLDHLVELIHADAAGFPIEPGRYDAALCLGASFIWDGLDGTLAALVPAVRAGGSVAVGEPYWRRWPLPDGFQPDPGEDFTTLDETVRRFEGAGLAATALIDASFDDWDRYETLHWLSAEGWLAEHPGDPDAEEIRRLFDRQRDRYLRWERDLLGWAIIAGRSKA